MQNTGDRIRVILDEMDGPVRGRQTRLAEIARCTKAVVGQLLKNPSQALGYEYAKNIESALGYRVDWIIKGTLPKLLKDSLAEDHAKDALDGVVELVTYFRQADSAARRRLLHYARQLDPTK